MRDNIQGPTSSPPPPAMSVKHVRAADPLLTGIIYSTGALSALSVLGGIIGIIWNAVSPTEIDIFGTKVTTGHVGVAFAALVLLCQV